MRETCEFNFRAFCERYFPERFSQPWTSDQLSLVNHVSHLVLSATGPISFNPMPRPPRGIGYTSICITAAEWALVYGHRRSILIVGRHVGLWLLDQVVHDYPEAEKRFERNKLILPGVAESEGTLTVAQRLSRDQSQHDFVILDQPERDDLS
jgi:hypothetical protein